MTITVDYDNRHPWYRAKTYSSNRPYSSIDVSYKGSAPVSYWALIDTGADYLCLSDQAAKAIGINLNASKVFVSVTTPLGSKANLPLWQVQLTVEGRTSNVDVLFDATFSGTPLLGRVALLEVIKFGIDLQGWLFADK